MTVLRQQQEQMLASQLFTAMTSTIRKPESEFPTPPHLATLSSIDIRSMSVNTTHKGRVLRGVIVSPEPVIMAGACALLQDEHGDLTRVRAPHASSGTWPCAT